MSGAQRSDRQGAAGPSDAKAASEERRQRRKAAAALRYDVADDTAPRVVASGYGQNADQIVEMAKQHHVPVHADPQIAELLAGLGAGSQIPQELFLIVAEILIFVYEVDKGFKR